MLKKSCLGIIFALLCVGRSSAEPFTYYVWCFSWGASQLYFSEAFATTSTPADSSTAFDAHIRKTYGVPTGIGHCYAGDPLFNKNLDEAVADKQLNGPRVGRAIETHWAYDTNKAKADLTIKKASRPRTAPPLPGSGIKVSTVAPPISQTKPKKHIKLGCGGCLLGTPHCAVPPPGHTCLAK